MTHPLNPNPSAPPPSLEHVKQMERDTERLNGLETKQVEVRSPNNLEHGFLFWPGCGTPIRSLIDGYIESLRAANHKVLSSQSGNSPATSVESPENYCLNNAKELWQAVITGENHDSDNPSPPVAEHDCFCVRCCAIRLLSLPSENQAPSPVSSVERDAQKDSGIPGGV